jgi:hypothetical protein
MLKKADEDFIKKASAGFGGSRGSQAKPGTRKAIGL